MEIKKLKEQWLKEDPSRESRKVFRFTNIFRFMEFCWLNKFTPDNTATAYDEEEQMMYIVRKEHENEFN